LIALATCSQTSALREEITTLAPCSAIRSAMARPMPRVEPVMTATLPFMSNKLMCLSPRCSSGLAGFVFTVMSFRGDAKHRTRNLEIPRCAIAHLWSGACAPSRNDSLSKFGLHNLRPCRLMHGSMRSIGHPRLLVDHRQPPDAAFGICNVVEPRHRAIVDVEGKAPLRQAAERKAD